MMHDFIDFTTYEIATGELIQTMRATTIQTVELQCSDEVSYVLGHWDKVKYMVRDGEVIDRPAHTEVS